MTKFFVHTKIIFLMLLLMTNSGIAQDGSNLEDPFLRIQGLFEVAPSNLLLERPELLAKAVSGTCFNSNSVRTPVPGIIFGKVDSPYANLGKDISGLRIMQIATDFSRSYAEHSEQSAVKILKSGFLDVKDSNGYLSVDYPGGDSLRLVEANEAILGKFVGKDGLIKAFCYFSQKLPNTSLASSSSGASNSEKIPQNMPLRSRPYASVAISQNNSPSKTARSNVQEDDSCFIDTYTATRNYRVGNSEEQAREIANLTCSGRFNLRIYLATRGAGAELFNSHSEAIEVENLVRSGEILLKDYLTLRSLEGGNELHTRAIELARLARSQRKR